MGKASRPKKPAQAQRRHGLAARGEVISTGELAEEAPAGIAASLSQSEVKKCAPCVYCVPESQVPFRIAVSSASAMTAGGISPYSPALTGR